MAQQKIDLVDNGAKAMRVLDALTPLNGTASPAVNATFFGQLFVNTTAKTAYIAVAVGSATPANDWKQITLAT